MLYEPRNLDSYLPGFVRNHVKAVVIPLQAEFVLRGRAELVKPGTLYIIVIVVDRAACREGRQRLHIRVLLEVVCVPIAEKDLVVRINMMIEARGSKVVAGVVVKESSLRLKLVDEEGTNGSSGGVDVVNGQRTVKNSRTLGRGQVGRPVRRRRRRADLSGNHRTHWAA